MNNREALGTVASPAGSSVAARRLCVVSRNPLVSGVFVAGLTTSVGSRDELEIIVDRRRAGPATGRPSIERRHQPNVVRALERDGFAIVLMPPTRPADAPGPPSERVAPPEPYDRRLERILWFKRRRTLRLRRWLILSVVVNAILVLFMLSPAVKALTKQHRPMAPAPSIVPTAPPSTGR